MLRKDVIEQAALFPKIIFPIFTNGTLIDDKALAMFDKHRNLIPILSIEGEETETDSRRGAGVYKQVDNKLSELKKRGILYGCSITVTKENITDVASKSFLEGLQKKGCGIAFYVEYVPVDEQSKDLALSESGQQWLKTQMALLKKEFPKTAIISFPGDEEKMGGCLAAGRGFFHINSAGGAEPCPFSPYSDTNLQNQTILQALRSPLFVSLNQQGILTQPHTGGCVLFEQQKTVQELAAQ
jgi:MoaA/NifB/PqqE/SkfB family radical SAM enzyme